MKTKNQMEKQRLLIDALSLHKSIHSKKILSAFKNDRVRLNQLELEKITGMEQSVIAKTLNRLVAINAIEVSHKEDNRKKYMLTGKTIKDFIIENIKHI